MNWPHERTTGLLGAIQNAIYLVGWIGPAISKAFLVANMPEVFAATDEEPNYDPPTSTTTAGFGVYDSVNKRAIIVLGGINGNQQVEAMVRGFTARVDRSQSYPEPFFTMALRWIQWLQTKQPLNQLVVIGQSFGGAVAHQIAGSFRGIATGVQPYVYTFGAPKAFLVSNRDGLNNAILRRCVTPRDPIPQVPGYGSIRPQTLQYLTNVDAVQWSHFCHPNSGLLLDPPEYPTQVSNSGVISDTLIVGGLASWLLGNTLFGDPQHSVESYRQATQGVTASGGGGDADVPMQVIRTRTITPTASELNTERAEAVAQSSVVFANDPTAAARAAAGAIVITPGEKWHGKKIAGYRYLYYGDQRIMPLRTRRLQISLVRYLNKYTVAGP